MLDTNHRYAKTWWQHTDKAVKRGEPADRRFAVVGYNTEEKCLVAWKVTYINNHEFNHPAFGRCVSRGDHWCSVSLGMLPIDPFTLESTNRSTPTAAFNPDSLYVLCV